jgi:hypothetical protein
MRPARNGSGRSRSWGTRSSSRCRLGCRAAVAAVGCAVPDVSSFGSFASISLTRLERARQGEGESEARLLAVVGSFPPWAWGGQGLSSKPARYREISWIRMAMADMPCSQLREARWWWHSLDSRPARQALTTREVEDPVPGYLIDLGY